MLLQSSGGSVPGTCGPHSALGSGAGIGGVPELKQIMLLAHRFEHPFQAQVLLLNSSSWSTVMPFAAAMLAQLSPLWTMVVAHDPSGLGSGEKSGSGPVEQQICCFGLRVEQKSGSELYLVMSLGGIPHLLARSAQPSPERTWIVAHVPSGLGSGEKSGSVPGEQQTC